MNPVLRLQAVQKDRNKIHIWAGGALVLGLVMVFAHGGFNATALLWSGACLALGGLLGFLFGIPRERPSVIINQPGIAAVSASVGEVTTSETASPAQRDATVPSAKPADKPVNPSPNQNSPESNLEQVSDWVTKLLLGGSLTQIANIPGIFTNWGAYVAQGIGDGKNIRDQTFATALVVYFLVLGFIAGYLITKVELGNSLKEK